MGRILRPKALSEKDLASAKSFESKGNKSQPGAHITSVWPILGGPDLNPTPWSIWTSSFAWPGA